MEEPEPEPVVDPEPVEDPVEDVEVVNPLSGRSMLVFGTSISWGPGNNGLGYSGIIAKNHDMVLHNYAVRGATIATVPDRGLILNQVKTTKSSGIDSTHVEADRIAYTNKGDGTHPTNLGYQTFNVLKREPSFDSGVLR